MAGIGSNTLRAALKERGWSHSKLVAELRRQAAATGEGLPKTESLLTLVSRWVNNHQQPDGFYRGLLARALDRPAADLFGEEDQAADLEAGAEPWRLARVLELSWSAPPRWRGSRPRSPTLPGATRDVAGRPARPGRQPLPRRKPPPGKRPSGRPSAPARGRGGRARRLGRQPRLRSQAAAPRGGLFQGGALPPGRPRARTSAPGHWRCGASCPPTTATRPAPSP